MTGLIGQNIIEQNAVESFIKGSGNSLFLSFNPEAFLPAVCLQPFILIKKIETVRFLLQLFQKDILIVRHDHRHADTDVPVVSGNNAGNTGDANTGSVNLRTFQMHHVPDGGHGQRQMRIIGHDGFP